MDFEARMLLLFVDGTDEGVLGAADKVMAFMSDDCRPRVVDVNDDPDLAEVTGVTETPTLIRLSPDPRRKVVGDLANTEEVARYLGSPWHPAEAQYTESS